MKRRAPRVYRWVERMTAPGLDTPEFTGYGPGCFPHDSVPQTLEPLFRFMAEEIFPELTDKLAFMDAHVAQHRPVDGQPVSDRPHRRHIGQVETQFRGVSVAAGVPPYLLYVLRRADEVLDALDDRERSRVQAGVESRGLGKALPGSRGYSVGRRGHIEVWEVPGPEQP